MVCLDWGGLGLLRLDHFSTSFLGGCSLHRFGQVPREVFLNKPITCSSILLWFNKSTGGGPF